MARLRRIALTLPLAATLAFAQQNPRSALQNHAFDFETSTPGAAPLGWGGSTDHTVVTDDQIEHSGRRSVRIDRSGTATMVSPP